MVLAAGCKDGAKLTDPAAHGTLHVQIEAATCASEGPFAIEVFIDHVLVGTPTFSVGSTASYDVTPGNHTLGGIATNGRYNWGSEVVTVPAGGEYTAAFGC